MNHLLLNTKLISAKPLWLKEFSCSPLASSSYTCDELVSMLAYVTLSAELGVACDALTHLAWTSADISKILTWLIMCTAKASILTRRM